MNSKYYIIIENFSLGKSKRIKNEVKKLVNKWIQFEKPYNYYSLYEIEGALYINVEHCSTIYPFHTVKLNQPNNDNQIIEFYGDGNVKNISITIGKFYPFISPSNVKVNNKHYLRLLDFSHNKLPAYLKKELDNEKCLCCASLSCPNNWCPSNTLEDITKEVSTNMELKALYSYYVLTNIIKRKYLNPDIPLIEYFI